MPNRVVRESILDSSRYLSVDEGAQLLYTHLLLLADDFGCLSVEHTFIGRRCFVERPTDTRLDDLLEQLARADLIRLYQDHNQHYAFIPRFRQRLKRESLKNPQPPDDLLEDDVDAQDKFNKLNGHSRNPAALGQPQGGPQAAPRLLKGSEVKGSEVKGSEVKGSEVKGSSSTSVVNRSVSLMEEEEDARARANTPATIPATSQRKRGKAKNNDAPQDEGTGDVVERIPTTDGPDFEIRQSHAQEFARLYPRVDIRQTLREIRGYNLTNPAKRKTHDEVLGHVNHWLKTEQNGA